MTHPENIKPGDWVFITGHRCKACGDDHDEYGGLPLRVLAVELPFLLCQLPDGSSNGLDIRVWGVKRIDSRLYVKRWFESNKNGVQPEQKPQRSSDHPRCVKCGERLRQRKVKRAWRWLCPVDGCGYDGGPVEA